MDTHIKILGILHVIYGAIGCLVAIGLLLFFGGISTMLMVTEGEALPAGILGIIGLLVSFFTILTSVPGVIAGFSLMQYKEWARIVIIIISIFYVVSGISFPIGLLGTGLGVYSLVVLFSTEATQVFKAFHSSS